MSRRLRRTTLCLVAALSLAGFGALGCGTETIDAQDLEEEISNDLEQSAGNAPESVDCPDDIEAENGTEFTCTVNTQDGEELDFNGEITGDGDSFEGQVEEQPSQ